jgi:DNA-binding NarL/FixJ family response regulator
MPVKPRPVNMASTADLIHASARKVVAARPLMGVLFEFGRDPVSWPILRRHEKTMTVNTPIRIMCVDDHPLFREGISTVILAQKDMSLVGTASTAQEAIEQFSIARPDVTLMDLRLPDRSGIAAISSIREKFPTARIVVLTTFQGDVEIQRAVAAGARGYILKSTPPEELVAIIRSVNVGRMALPNQVAQDLAEHVGSEGLSEREIQVLRQVAEGNRNQDIGKLLSISEETVKAHLRSILDKLDARDRTQAVSIGIRRGIIQL